MENKSYSLNDWNNFIEEASGKIQSKVLEYYENTDKESGIKPKAIAIATKDFNNNCTDIWGSTNDIRYLSLLKEEVVIVTVSLIKISFCL